MANAKLNVTAEELASYYIPKPFWPEGHPNPSWVDEPLLYTSPEVAQTFLDNVSGRADRERAFMELLDLGAELDEMPQSGEPSEQLLLIDIPIQRYTKSFI